ncbi:hypothetical protein RJ639_009344 [Escallonia herrerae]|uniref:YqgF/RNase H-like domain-containing protein n=1 Tax=Escallonia herrerae TaxID=1293975 RepID=A0AA89ASE7_9ASTE|nr:hypothetical protein RJ639_009344 [Escallonia herrerae]
MSVVYSCHIFDNQPHDLSDGPMKYMKSINLFKELLKPNAIRKERLLGLDVGDKYVGLAVSDVHNEIASPLSVLLRKKTNMDLMATDFQSWRELKSCLAISLKIAIQVKLFVDDISKTGKLDNVTYTFWDECFTSKNVELLLKPLNLHPVQSKTIMDKFAAVGILQGYLDSMNRTSVDQNMELSAD